ncbi:hypothetical protein Tco_1317293 [Tanacetum coccineum]
MEEINNFQQEQDETLYQAWEHFKELLIKCPQHYLTKMHEKRSYVPQFLEAYSKVSHIDESIPQKEKDPGKVRLIGETLVLNRSLDPFLEDYIELNDLNEPFKLRRNQGDDLIPTIKEGEVIEEFRTRDEDLDTGIDDYPILEDIDAYRDEGMGDVSEKDEKNGISHAYQKLKGFYKGVLNLGPDYIRDAKTEEWLTRGHISVHEME